MQLGAVEINLAGESRVFGLKFCDLGPEVLGGASQTIDLLLVLFIQILVMYHLNCKFLFPELMGGHELSKSHIIFLNLLEVNPLALGRRILDTLGVFKYIVARHACRKLIPILALHFTLYKS